MRPIHLLLPVLLVAGCDSQAKLTATLPSSANPPVVSATETVNAAVTPPVTTLSFTTASLPPELQNATSLALVVQGRPVPAVATAPGTVAVTLPPNTFLSTDLAGNATVVMVANATTTDVVALHVTPSH